MKSKKLTNLGRRKALKSQLDWIAGEEKTVVSKTNHLKVTFPDWLEPLKTPDEWPSTSRSFLEKDLSQFCNSARAIGIGQTNIAIALTQILTECLTGECVVEGIPPIRDWNDVGMILRAITTAEAGTELWAKAIGVEKILGQLENESDT